MASLHHWTLFIISAGEWRPCDHLHPSVLYLTPTKIFRQLLIWLVQILPCTFKLPTRETYRFCWPSHRAFISIFQLRVSPDPSVISTHVLLYTPVSSRGGYLMVLVASQPLPLSVPSGHILAALLCFFVSPVFVVQYWLWKYLLTWKIDKTCALLL